eukprot:TRINITY_DN5015_c0_g1_i1.p1 TRINITY_DN5015_c0_g1~~TRINITY_DN5015_c0_g1_i1.p1  ORF type:complete len:237 (+),score=24.71 TRINITY_DN5015_c0_g1_i1:562-1272(+)
MYVINIGDSRCFLSKNFGQKVVWLSQDHRPSLESEKQRIIAAGGQIYQNLALAKQIFNQLQKLQKSDCVSEQQLNSQGNCTEQIQSLVPLRILPGRLNVSRTFGDIESKISVFGGKANVIISTPEILHFPYSSDTDFIFLGCDGMFDKTTNKEMHQIIWRNLQSNYQQNSQNCCVGKVMEEVIQDGLRKKAFDNITGIVVMFRDGISGQRGKWECVEEVLFEDSSDLLRRNSKNFK